jgi:hypothetical protein
LHRFFKDTMQRIKTNGFIGEFTVRIGENKRPAAVLEADWLINIRRWRIQNIFDSHAGLNMSQLQADRHRIHTIVDGLAAIGQHHQSHHHRKETKSWLETNLITTYCTNKVIQDLEESEEEHKQDGVLMFFALRDVILE